MTGKQKNKEENHQQANRQQAEIFKRPVTAAVCCVHTYTYIYVKLLSNGIMVDGQIIISMEPRAKNKLLYS